MIAVLCDDQTPKRHPFVSCVWFRRDRIAAATCANPPIIGINAAVAIEYADPTQINMEPPWRALIIVGRAVATHVYLKNSNFGTPATLAALTISKLAMKKHMLIHRITHQNVRSFLLLRSITWGSESDFESESIAALMLLMSGSLFYLQVLYTRLFSAQQPFSSSRSTQN